MKWNILSGTKASKKAAEQNVQVGEADVFYVTLDKPLQGEEYVIDGMITCHGCQREFSFQAGALFGGGISGGGTATCSSCGNQIVLSVYDLHQVPAGTEFFLTAKPFTSQRGQLNHPIKISISNISE